MTNYDDMEEIEDIRAAKSSDKVTVFVKFFKRQPGGKRKRFYMHDALEYAKTLYPGVTFGRVLKNGTASNDSDSASCAWEFEIVSGSKTPKKKKNGFKQLEEVDSEE